MLKQIVLYLLRWLETSLDPELQGRIQAYELKVAAAEAEAKKRLAEIEASKKKLLELSLELAENNRKRIEIENAILHAKESAAAKKAELDSLSPRDAVRVDL